MPTNAAYNDVYAKIGVMGDEDRTEFQFNKKLTVTELLTLLERNPRVSMMCDWMPSEAIKNGYEFDEDAELEFDENPENESMTQSEFLEFIHFYTKLHQAMMYCRLLGDALMVFLGENPNLAEPCVRYYDCAVYHKLDGTGNGWRIKSVYKSSDNVDFRNIGLTKEYELKLFFNTQHMRQETFTVTAERCIVWANPKKRMTWSGTPSSELIAKVAQLEELMIRALSKRGLLLGGGFYKFGKIKDEPHAARIADKFNNGLIDEFYCRNLDIEFISPQIMGHGQEFKELFEILKKYMACAMQVNPEAMDSGSDKGIVANYSTIKGIQAHFKPYMEQTFRMFNFKNPNFTWNEPVMDIINPNLPVQNRDEYNAAGQRQQDVKQNV